MLLLMKDSKTKKTFKVAKLFDEIAGKYDRINSVLSFGLDKRWRAQVLKHLPKEKNIEALDIACGSLEQMLSIAKHRPDITFSGIDISEELINVGKKKLAKKNINIGKIVKASALDLPFEDAKFSAITLSFGIRNMEDFDKALEEACRVLTKGGKICILEFSLPERKWAKKLSLFYLKHILPKIGNLLSNHSYAYTYLNETIQDFPCGESFVKHMKRLKFTNVKHHPMTFGMVTLYVGEKE
jgi:demethylmenaquinone methyltransferase / 2-methoxy-6-polyprenyl-1,4-benzoquinol methylase